MRTTPESVFALASEVAARAAEIRDFVGTCSLDAVTSPELLADLAVLLEDANHTLQEADAAISDEEPVLPTWEEIYGKDWLKWVADAE